MLENIQKTAAEKRLEEEAKAVKGPKQMAIRDAVKEALSSFCRQNDEFERAVADSTKRYSECLDEVTKDVGNVLSDLEAYRRAVRFYFPGADVEMTLTVRMSTFEGEPKKQTAGELRLSLMDLL